MQVNDPSPFINLHGDRASRRKGSKTLHRFGERIGRVTTWRPERDGGLLSTNQDPVGDVVIQSGPLPLLMYVNNHIVLINGQTESLPGFHDSECPRRGDRELSGWCLDEDHARMDLHHHTGQLQMVVETRSIALVAVGSIIQQYCGENKKEEHPSVGHRVISDIQAMTAE